MGGGWRTYLRFGCATNETRWRLDVPLLTVCGNKPRYWRNLGLRLELYTWRDFA